MFKFVYDDEESGIYNMMELHKSDLTHDVVAERFTEFLRGCGYIFDHFAQYKLVHEDGTVEPSFEEKYQKIMAAAEERYEETGSTFPVI